MEIWKRINGFENYEISNFGRVKSFCRKKEIILKAGIGDSGYYNVVLNRKTKRVHQLVAISFLNHVPCGHKLVVNHIDFNKLNNHVDNLEIVTSRENANMKHLVNSSTYTGVCFIKSRNKWRANIVYNKNTVNLGDFDSEIEASKYYENALYSILNYLPIKTKQVFKKSKYTGVTWNESRNRWVSRITKNKKVFYLGYFKSEKDAGIAYLKEKGLL